MRRHPAIPLVLLASAAASNAAVSVLPLPGQPTKAGVPGTFEIIGDSGVSAQQLFLGAKNKVRPI